MLKTKATVTSALLGVIAVLSSPTTSAGAAISKIDIPPGFVVSFPLCPQHEAVILQGGYLQVLLNDRTDKSGGRHITFRQQLIGVTAVGQVTGAEYRMPGNVRFQQLPPYTTINDPAPFGAEQLVVHSTVTFQVVPVGGADADRISIHVLVQNTYTPDGGLTAEINDVNATCNG